VWLTVKNIFLSKPNQLEFLSYLVCGLHNFYNLGEFVIAFGDKSFWDSVKSASGTAIKRIAIALFDSVVPRVFHGSVSLDNALTDLLLIKSK